MKNRVKAYLGIKDELIDEALDTLIDKAINEVKENSSPKYFYKVYSIDDLPIDKSIKGYREYLYGASECLVSGVTLGSKIDQLVKYYMSFDSAYGIIIDAASNAYLEDYADGFEKNLDINLSYRFCPGYQGTPLSDVRSLTELINAYKHLGITVLESGLMVPLKSMIGIIAINKENIKSCTGCVKEKNCPLKEEGLRCYKD